MYSYLRAFIRSKIRQFIASQGYVVLRKSQFEAGHLGKDQIDKKSFSASRHVMSPDLEEDAKNQAALRGIAKRLVEANSSGDIVDCGLGRTDYLIIIEELVYHRDCARMVRLIDTTVDPSHSFNDTLPSWGNTSYYQTKLLDKKIKSRERKMHFPRMFSESGYPSDLIQMEFIVSDAQIKKYCPEKIALLILSGDNYPLNALCKAHLIPAVRSNGILIIDRDPVAMSLIELGAPNFRFDKVGPSLWIGLALAD